MIPTPKAPQPEAVPIANPPRDDAAAQSPHPPRAASMPVSMVEADRLNPEMLSLVEESKKPGKHYRWVRSRKDENYSAVEKAKLKGYTIVRKTTGGVETVVKPDDQADGSIKIGDLVLMECPAHLTVKRADAKRALTNARMAASQAETKEMAAQKGVKIISDPDHNSLRQGV